MKAIKLIYNPYSGDRKFKHALDDCAAVFAEHGYETHLLRMGAPEAFNAAISQANEAMVVAAGGDGTVNLVLNALKRHKKTMPLGIIPAGTANDFALYLKMPKDFREAARALMEGTVLPADIGQANDQYFINVCGAGFLVNVSQQVDPDAKESLGKVAYYIKGLEQVPKFTPMPLRITTPSGTVEDEFLLFTILNGGGAGGFDRLAPSAKIDDGILEFIGFRATGVLDSAAVFFKIIQGDYLNDPRILFMRESQFTIEHTLPSQPMDSGLDGESGPPFPLHVTCVPEGYPLVVPPGYR